MLILAFLASLLHLVFSAPTATTPIDAFDPLGLTIPLTIFGRELPGCVNPARYRTLQGIIWSCLATIFACTWVSMHPNVPDPRWSGFRRLWERIALMFYAIIAPECIAVWAFRQRMMAVKYTREHNSNFGSPSPLKRSTIQCIKEWLCASATREAQKFNPSWALMHGFLFEMQGLVYSHDGEPCKANCDGLKLPREVKALHKAGRNEVIQVPSQIPRSFDLSEERVNDKSKGDAFTKLLVIVQTSWFIIQCIARWATHLPVTELELVTLAFASLNIVIYVVWWNKPHNMSMAIRVQGVSAPLPRQHDVPDHRCPEDDADESATLTGDAEDKASHGEAFDTSAEILVRFYSSEDKGTENSQVALMTGLIGALFGGVHLIPSWLASFSSVWRKYLWLASSVFIIVEPMAVVGSLWIVKLALFPGLVENMIVCLVLFPSHNIGFFLYIACRLILIFLAFDNLQFLLPGAFLNVEWLTFFPHI
ncbi:hypothetical protein AN958_11160 [Leucoagaricus sp. SymC.cos]|nr:hypothetical protein AN958_11160 [Leucoagaricus sp. SymC.cos]